LHPNELIIFNGVSISISTACTRVGDGVLNIQSNFKSCNTDTNRYRKKIQLWATVLYSCASATSTVVEKSVQKEVMGEKKY